MHAFIRLIGDIQTRDSSSSQADIFYNLQN